MRQERPELIWRLAASVALRDAIQTLSYDCSCADTAATLASLASVVWKRGSDGIFRARRANEADKSSVEFNKVPTKRASTSQ